MHDKIFEYRIIEYTAPDTDGREYTQFMPQRGVSSNLEGIGRWTYWRDAVPMAAPTVQIAEAWVVSLRDFDARQSEGKIVWKEE
jgi:hypothetical protein